MFHTLWSRCQGVEEAGAIVETADLEREEAGRGDFFKDASARNFVRAEKSTGLTK